MKRTSWKILAVFWLIAAVILAGWYVFLQVKYRNIENLKPLMRVAPVSGEKQKEIRVLMDIYAKLGEKGEEKNLLVLFQNDLELRPGGGFIGAFAIMKLADGRIKDIQVFDTGNFDKNIPDAEIPDLPYPENSGLSSLAGKMRDSNWSPDFKTNAEKAEYFWKLDSGSENIDGVVAINTGVLNSILSITGPVKIDGYPGEYRDENAILQLEYQVEKGYLEQGIEKGARKNIMGELADILVQKAHSFSLPEQIALAGKLEKHLERKDIQLFFKDEALQSEIENTDWAGRVKDAKGDYLMVVDANLLALKSDFCIRRKVDYAVDLAGETPQAVLSITYEHTCRAKDWMTSNYRDWLRVYAPAGAFLEEVNGQTDEVVFSEELGKKVFGMFVFVPIGETKTITLKYRLPESVKNNNYSLLVQKQSGSGELPASISVKYPDGSEKKAQEILLEDKEFEF